MPKTETKQTENMLPEELHHMAATLGEVVKALPEAEAAAERAVIDYRTAATGRGDSATAWAAREAATARVSALKSQKNELEQALHSRLKSALKPTAESPKAARAADREATASATGEAVALLQAAHESLLKAREAFLMDGGHVRRLAQEVALVARNLPDRAAFTGALPAHGPDLPPPLTQACQTVEGLLRIYQT